MHKLICFGGTVKDKLTLKLKLNSAVTDSFDADQLKMSLAIFKSISAEVIHNSSFASYHLTWVARY